MKRDFLHVTDFSTDEILETFSMAKEVKEKFRRREHYKPFDGYTMAMIFAKPSARTRISFEIAEKRLSADSFSFSTTGA